MASLGEPLVLQSVVLANIEVNEDRVLLDDGRQQRGTVGTAGRDVVAARDSAAADQASDRSTDAGEGQLELGRFYLCLGDLDGGLGITDQILAIVEDFLGKDALLDQRTAPIDILGGILDPRPGLLELSLSGRERALEWPRID